MSAGITTDRRQGGTESEERDAEPNDHVGSHRRKTEWDKAECKCFSGREADQLPSRQTCACRRLHVDILQPDERLQEAKHVFRLQWIAFVWWHLEKRSPRDEPKWLVFFGNPCLGLP